MKGKKVFLIVLIIAVIIATTAVIYFGIIKGGFKPDTVENYEVAKQEAENNKTNIKRYELKNGKVSEFDLSFLKMENEKTNKIYSPLSIKYALKMLEAGASGEAKNQISNIVGDYKLTRYNSNNNMSLANVIFIRDTYQNNVKSNYIDALKNNYDAELQFDSFTKPDNINSWVSEKTLGLIDNLIDSIDNDTNLILINALGIDMEWEKKFIQHGGVVCSYPHEDFSWHEAEQVEPHDFEGNSKVSGMTIVASINNYDIVKELGEENIRKTVGDAFRKWAKNLTPIDYEYNSVFDGDLSDQKIEEKLTQYLDGGYYYNYQSEGYMSELNSNYKKIDTTTDFSIYVDDDVKAFTKDLKTYDGTTLQYVGIMPTSTDLDNYVNSIDSDSINNIINNMKDINNENFKEGVVTKITGYIPKFKFEYDLSLKQDLNNMGINNVFEQGKANLTEISEDEDLYISDAVHKANIEFTQDGIKAAAATMMGGMGAGDTFDYIFDIPVEEIDLTFDKPYLFLIRDKDTGEVWFVGTVYEPLLWENESEKNNTEPRT